MPKTPSQDTFPSNKLEELLAAAFENPDLQENFYEELLTSDVYILTDKNTSPQGKTPANDDDVEVSIMSSVMEDGTPFIPVFTSLVELQHSIEEEHDFLTLTGQEFLQLVDGTDIVINPAHQYGIHLDPEESQALLDR